MRSQTTIVIVGALLAIAIIIAAALIAGMSSQSQPRSSPTLSLITQSTPAPTTSQQQVTGPVPKGTDQSAYFSGLLESQHYVLKQPLAYSINSIGNDVYTGTVARGTLTSTVRIEVCDNINDVQTRAQDYISAFMAQGYRQQEQQPTYWYGTTANGEAMVTTDTTHLYVMNLWY